MSSSFWFNFCRHFTWDNSRNQITLSQIVFVNQRRIQHHGAVFSDHWNLVPVRQWNVRPVYSTSCTSLLINMSAERMGLTTGATT